MKIATWNVNSIRARLERLLEWLAAEQPDVACLQELKTAADGFPRLELEAAGYRAAVLGQKAYNGVAILSRHPLEDVRAGMPDASDPPQARVLAATTGGVRVVCAYVPNGAEPASEKYAYKLDWLARFRDRLSEEGVPGAPVVVCGDFNICQDDRDVHDPGLWEGTVLYNPQVRAAMAGLLDLGLVDVYRRLHPESGRYTFWDYQGLAFPKDLGLRIDLVLATPALAARCTEAVIRRDLRKGSKPSDHVPVVAVFDPA